MQKMDEGISCSLHRSNFRQEVSQDQILIPILSPEKLKHVAKLPTKIMGCRTGVMLGISYSSMRLVSRSKFGKMRDMIVPDVFHIEN